MVWLFWWFLKKVLLFFNNNTDNKKKYRQNINRSEEFKRKNMDVQDAEFEEIDESS